MVAISGRGWKLAPCLVALFAEADRLFPNRSTASDGSIGDTAHATRESDHNPDDGYVYAGDLTDDKAHGCDADLLARHLIASKDPRVKYLIWNRTVVRSYAKPGVPAWTPEPYTGLNPHDKHTHVSVLASARDDLRPWFPVAPPTTAPEDTVKATYIRQRNSPRVFLAGIGITPRPVDLFKDAEYHAKREGIEILTPPTDGDEDVADGEGTVRKVMLVDDGSLFGI